MLFTSLAGRRSTVFLVISIALAKLLAQEKPPVAVDFDAGNGLGSIKAQRVAGRADMCVFLLWQFGAVQ